MPQDACVTSGNVYITTRNEREEELEHSEEKAREETKAVKRKIVRDLATVFKKVANTKSRL